MLFDNSRPFCKKPLYKEPTCRVQKKSRLHGSEPEEDFAFYVIFEEGLVMCINNPVSVKFSLMLHRLLKAQPFYSKNSLRHTMQSSRILVSFDCLKIGKFMIKI